MLTFFFTVQKYRKKSQNCGRRSSTEDATVVILMAWDTKAALEGALLTERPWILSLKSESRRRVSIRAPHPSKAARRDKAAPFVRLLPMRPSFFRAVGREGCDLCRIHSAAFQSAESQVAQIINGTILFKRTMDPNIVEVDGWPLCCEGAGDVFRKLQEI